MFKIFTFFLKQFLKFLYNSHYFYIFFYLSCKTLKTIWLWKIRKYKIQPELFGIREYDIKEPLTHFWSRLGTIKI